jgi:hypothetical protein
MKPTTAVITRLLTAYLLGIPVANAICRNEVGKTFTMLVDFTASPTGSFRVAECEDEGANPVIGLTRGVKYTFVQQDASNWFHPLGFAYQPDGAHADAPELEPSVSQGTSTCASFKTCPAPVYQLNDEYFGDTWNLENFGLDEYEPKFFLPLLDWIALGTFSVSLTFNDNTFGQDIFYFCHVRICFAISVGTSLSGSNPFLFALADPLFHERSDQAVRADDW